MGQHEIFGIPVSGSTFYDISNREFNIPGLGACTLDTIRFWVSTRPDGELARYYPERVNAAKDIYNQIITEIGGETLSNNNVNRRTLNDYFSDAKRVYEESRAEYEKMINAHKTARDRYNTAGKECAGDEVQLTIAKGEWLKADSEYKQNMRDFEQRRDSALAEIRNELREHLDSFYMATPDKLDTASMQLLNTGILTGRELENLAAQHRNNPTMLRIIGRRAEDMVSELRNSGYNLSTSEDYNYALNLSDRIKGIGSGEKELQLFDSLSQAAAYCTSGKRAGYPTNWTTVFDQTYEAASKEMTASPAYTGTEE